MKPAGYPAGFFAFTQASMFAWRLGLQSEVLDDRWTEK